jgi:hypothetical protein
MNCEKCGGESAVIDSRDIYGTKRRRRECLACKFRWSTYEIRWQPVGRRSFAGMVAAVAAVEKLQVKR